MNKKISGIHLVAFIILIAGCLRPAYNSICPQPFNYNRALPVIIKGGNAIINLNEPRQTIRGFGGSSAWLGALTDAEMNILYGTDSNQFGFTVLRIRIDPSGSSNWGNELANAQKAISHGAIVLATPWSPPAVMKTNNSAKGGGQLDSQSYAAYSTYLGSFAAYMAANGAPLYAISVQNEPDWPAPYESCVWTPGDMFNFIKYYAPATGSTKLLAAESDQFNHAFTDPILNDSLACSYLSIVGGHIYGGGLIPYPLAISKGKEVWMTEHQDTSTSWAGALKTAKEISDCLAVADFNVYNFWWLKKSWGPVDSLGNPAKRGYAMAQFARFIRPGYQRVNATYQPSANIYLSAYTCGARLVIVALNMGDTIVSQPITITGGQIPGIFTPHTTSANENLSAETRIKVEQDGFIYRLAAQSITTFVSD